MDDIAKPVCPACSRRDNELECICSPDLRCYDPNCLYYRASRNGRTLAQIEGDQKRKDTIARKKRMEAEGDTEHKCALPPDCAAYPHLHWACKECEVIWGRCWRKGIAFWRRDWRSNSRLSEGDRSEVDFLLKKQGELPEVDFDVTRAGDPEAEAIPPGKRRNYSSLQ